MNELTKVWEVDDGAVDINEYSKQSIKVLWILRETNGNNFDFKKFLNSPKSYKRWKSTVGLVVKTSNAIFEDLDYIEGNKYPKDISAVMRKVAWINVKKTGGSSISNYNQLKLHADKNSSLIENQVKELAPDVIILAGTKSLVSEIIKKEIRSFTGKNTVVIGAYHTNQRVIKHHKYIENILTEISFSNKTNTIA